MSFDRQEKALREFKQIMADLVHLLRTSTPCTINLYVLGKSFKATVCLGK